MFHCIHNCSFIHSTVCACIISLVYTIDATYSLYPAVQFMSRMVSAYMHEEELRARHQATLLRLREDALQEKTEAHLEWLKVKKKALQKKGDDDRMPPLARMERGLLKKFKQQQVSASYTEVGFKTCDFLW